LRPEEVSGALADPSRDVRRRACDLAGRLRTTGLARELTAALSDCAPTVVEAACYALGELYAPADGAGLTRAGLTGEDKLPAAEVVSALGLTATAHPEPLCREAAVAALGSLGSLGCGTGLPAVLAALEDKPAIRRRAVVALAAFDGAEVGSALARATTDPDWQVRQAAEDLVGRRPRPS
jgi:HEAT repeat protein